VGAAPPARRTAKAAPGTAIVSWADYPTERFRRVTSRQCNRAGAIQIQEANPQSLLPAGCKGIYAIDRRQRPTPGVGATNGDIVPV